MKEKMIITLYQEKDVAINLRMIVENLNKLTKNLYFKIGKSDFVVTGTELSKKVIKNIEQDFQEEISDDFMSVFISEKPYDNNFFYDSNSNGKILLYSLYDWERYTQYSKNTGMVYFIADLLLLDIDEDNDRHNSNQNKKCIYNFAWDKQEIDLGIKNSYVCDECQEAIIEKENPKDQQLLDGAMILLEEIRKSNVTSNDIGSYWDAQKTQKEKVKIFFSYAHEDREYLDEFKDYIKIFERNGLVERWDDNELIVGEKWDNTIKDKIYSADIIVFLLSASSLASEYIYNNELKIAFELNEIDEAYVIPIVIKDCLWDMTEFQEFHILPQDGIAVNSWKLREEAWTSTARGLKKAIDNIISAKEQSLERIQEDSSESRIGKVLNSVKKGDTDKDIVLKFLKTYHRWWFNIPRIINWGSERDGFQRLKSLTQEELKSILTELEEEGKIVSKPSSKNKNSLLFKAK